MKKSIITIALLLAIFGFCSASIAVAIPTSDSHEPVIQDFHEFLDVAHSTSSDTVSVEEQLFSGYTKRTSKISE